jgi:hypothetical protein
VTLRQVEVRKLADGADGPSTAGEVVAHSAAEWAAAWTAAGGDAGAVPPIDGVDFEREVVVGLFAGQRPTGGWAIELGPARPVGGGAGASLAYAVVGPGKGCMTTQALTAPYLVAAVAGDDVTFIRSERLAACE